MPLSPREIGRVAEALEQRYESCSLCPRRCAADRRRGKAGFCGLPDHPVVASALPHFGEEPPLSGTGGAGTIFFSSCNLRCVFCQNHQISHGGMGKAMTREELAGVMVRLEKQGCHNIEWVTPTPQLPAIVGALALAREEGLTLPVVYNCGGYENPDVIALLDGIVDIYLPDFKFGGDEAAHRLAGVRDYVAHARGAIAEMVRQAGTGLETTGDIARRGVIVRHLLLPGMAKNTKEVLRWIGEHLSLSVPLSLMGQYTPIASVGKDPLLGRRVGKKEYEEIITLALDMGFEYLFIQDLEGKPLVPDFRREDPFEWGDGGRG